MRHLLPVTVLLLPAVLGYAAGPTSHQDGPALERTRQNAAVVRAAIERLKDDDGYPAGGQELTLDDLYDEDTVDGWGRGFKYMQWGSRLEYVLVSAGPNGEYFDADDVLFDTVGREWRRGGAAERTSAVRAIETWQRAVAEFEERHGRLPDDGAELFGNATSRPLGEDAWSGSLEYFRGSDLWLLRSDGPDGLEGTGDELFGDELGPAIAWQEVWRRKLAHLVADAMPDAYAFQQIRQQALSTGSDADYARVGGRETYEHLEGLWCAADLMCADNFGDMECTAPFERQARDEVAEILRQYRSDALEPYLAYVTRLKLDVSLARLEEARDGAERYRRELGRYPVPADGLAAVAASGQADLANVPRTDDWGVPFVYEAEDDLDYRIRFSGADGVPDTADDYLVHPTGPPQLASTSESAPTSTPEISAEEREAQVAMTLKILREAARALRTRGVQAEAQTNVSLESLGLDVASEDAWGRKLRVFGNDRDGIFVSSWGPDRFRGTRDDLKIDLETGCEIGTHTVPVPAQESTARIEVALELRPGEVPAGLHVSTEGHVAAVLEVEGGQVLAVGEHRSEVFDSLSELTSGTHPLAVAAIGTRDSAWFVVTVERAIPCDYFPTTITFLEGTSTPLFRYQSVSGLVWSVAGEDAGTLRDDLHAHGKPAFDARGVVRAFRSKVDDGYVVRIGATTSPAYAWAADPVLVRYRGEETFFQRYWDGEQMHVVYADQHLRVTWAGDPVVSPDGERLAFVAHRGGAPAATPPLDSAADFVAGCEARHDGESVSDLIEGGEEVLIVDGVEGEAGLWVGDPVFSPDSAHVAYAYQETLESPVRAYVDGPEHLVAGPEQVTVWNLSFDRSSSHLYFAALSEGDGEGAYEEKVCIMELATGTAKRYTTPQMSRVIGGPSGQFLAQTSVEGPSDLVLFHGIEDAEAFGTYERVELFGFTSSGNPVARVTDPDHQKLYVNGFSPGYSWVSEPILGSDGTVAAVVETEEGYQALAFRPDGSEILSSGHYPALDEPNVLADGTVWMRAHHDAEGVTRYVGYPDVPDTWSGWLGYRDGSWSPSELQDEVAEAEVAADERTLSWKHRRGEEWYVTTHAPRGPLTSGPFAALRGFAFLPDGQPVFGAEMDRYPYLAVGSEGALPWVSSHVLERSPIGEMVAVRFESDGRRGMALVRPSDKWALDVGFGNHMDETLLWSADGRHAFAIAVSNGDSPPGGPLPGGGYFGQPCRVERAGFEPWANETYTYDAVSPPTASADGAAVYFAAFADGVVERVTFPVEPASTPRSK